MSGGGQVTSLLPDNPGVQFEAVQGGGGYVPESKKVSGWHSTPLIIPVASNSTSSELAMNASHLTIKNYKEAWRRTLGPSVPSRHKPRADPYVVIGSLDIVTCPTYIVAPLRGDLDAAKDTIFWAHELLNSDFSAHVIFIGPITEGGSRADGDMIEKMLESLMASNPGHVVCVGTNSLATGSLDGLVLHAMPHSSKQVVFGYLPDPDDIYSRSSRMIDCLDIETVRIPADAKRHHQTGERMLYIHFNKATSVYNRDKQPKPQIIRTSHDWKAPPGWVTRINFQTKGGEAIQSGGEGAHFYGRGKPPAPVPAPEAGPAAAKPETAQVPAVANPATAVQNPATAQAQTAPQKVPAPEPTGQAQIAPQPVPVPAVAKPETPTVPETAAAKPKGVQFDNKSTVVPINTSAAGINKTKEEVVNTKKTNGPTNPVVVTNKGSIPVDTSVPVASKPTGDKPSGDKPSGDKPSGDKPSGDKPSGDKPSGDKALPPKPTGPKPIPVFDMSKIRKSDAFEEWKKGKFTPGELDEFEKHGLMFTNEIYAMLLKGLYDCKTEGDAMMSSTNECAVYRYIMAHHYLSNTQKKNSAPPAAAAAPVAKTNAAATPATPAPATPAPATPAPATLAPATPAPVTKTNAAAPPAPVTNTSAKTPAPPEPSAPPSLKITFTKKSDSNNTFEYAYDNKSDVIVFGKNPNSDYEKTSKQLTLPEDTERIKIGLKDIDKIPMISNSHFAIKKVSETEWYIVDLKSSFGIIDSNSKTPVEPITEWNDDQIKKTKIYDKSKFTLSPTLKNKGGVDSENPDAIILEISLPGVEKTLSHGEGRAAAVKAARATEAKPATPAATTPDAPAKPQTKATDIMQTVAAARNTTRKNAKPK